MKTKLKIEYQQYLDGTHVCIAHENGDWFCDCGPEGNRECENNAEFIAAAPDLLEALEMAQRLLKSKIGDLYHEWPEYEVIEQAIKRATE